MVDDGLLHGLLGEDVELAFEVDDPPSVVERLDGLITGEMANVAVSDVDGRDQEGLSGHDDARVEPLGLRHRRSVGDHRGRLHVHLRVPGVDLPGFPPPKRVDDSRQPE